MNTLYIFLRTDHKDKNNACGVYLRTLINKKKYDITLKVRVLPKDWNEKDLKVKKSDSDWFRKNNFIEHSILKAQNILADYRLKDKTLTFEVFESLFRNNYNSNSFYDFFENELEKRYNYSSETLHTYKTQISKMKLYKPVVNFGDITPEFIEGYRRFMINERRNNENTVNKGLAMLKVFFNWAVDAELIDTKPFNKIKIKKIAGKREHLTINEVERLQQIYDTNTLIPSYQNVLRYFLFACYTGLRFSDVKAFKMSNISKSIIEDTEKYFIKQTQHKTKTLVTIPLHPQAKKLIDWTKAANENVFRVICGSDTLRYIKEIAKKTNIEKNIFFHTARNSFGTILYEFSGDIYLGIVTN